ncbi:hypothetical protein HSX11_14965 [Oxalobacteraceae bacterium]|nr:hypothetical protein [Oxalobacteraceae bacterium]
MDEANQSAPTAPAKPYWFPAKSYGWGWGLPATWQGWIVFILFLAGLSAGSLIVPVDRNPALYVAYVTALAVLFLLVCWWKGEPTRWRWGKK